MQHSAVGPVVSAVIGETHGQVAPLLAAGRIREQQSVASAWMVALAGITDEGRLADRFDQGFVVPLVPPGHPAVAAECDLPGAPGPIVVARVEQHVSVLQLDDAAFVDLVHRSGTAQYPGFPVVVAVDDMGVVALGAGLDMIAGNQKAARRKLDAVARPGGVPRPVRSLGGGGNVPRLAPRAAVVLARRDPHGPRALARPVDDPGFVVDAQVVGHRQPYGSGLTVDHGTGIAAGVPGVPPDHRLVRPRASAVLAALHQHIDVACIAPAVPPAFAEGEDRSPARHDDRGYAVGIVSVRAAGPQDGLRAGTVHE